jgi:hypothetical protein
MRSEHNEPCEMYNEYAQQGQALSSYSTAYARIKKEGANTNSAILTKKSQDTCVYRAGEGISRPMGSNTV